MSSHAAGNASSRARVLLVEDHVVVRQGLTRLIESQPDLEVVGEVGTAREAIPAFEATLPDVAVVDLSLPGRSGLDLIKDLIARWPEARILVLSMYSEGLYFERCLRAGAMGYVMKEASSDRFLEALRHVLDGKLYASPTMKERLIERAAADEFDVTSVDRLSDRELEVLRLLGEGRATREIAETLGLSGKTVETYRERLKRKLDLDSSAALMRYAVLWVSGNIG